jgi:putative FmdB family regulatory protein
MFTSGGQQMPIYEYRCGACGTEFEELVTRDPGKPLPCPKCHSENTEKKLSVLGGISMGAKSQPACPSAGSCAAAGSSCCGSGQGCGLG